LRKWFNNQKLPYHSSNSLIEKGLYEDTKSAKGFGDLSVTKRNKTKQRGVSHCGLAIYILKKMETQLYFTMQKYINLQKIL
jgi:hypothetical protein